MSDDPIRVVKVNGQDKVVPTWALFTLVAGAILAVGWWAGTMENRVGNIERLMQELVMEMRAHQAAAK